MNAILVSIATLISIVHSAPYSSSIDINNPVVQTTYGPIRGARYQLAQTFSNQATIGNVVAFIGVPYASPPTGVNRFRPPRFPIEWTNELDCSNRRVLCPQGSQRFQLSQSASIPEDEDCLHLNIYVPVDRAIANLPVLVYIHGGEFKYGGKDLYKPDYLLNIGTTTGHNMIVVTINYRLGILGFLSTDDLNQPGNNGIRDQVLALQWIRENIAKFNGNPNNVTIMGHDAGGVSVSMHLLNPDVKDYFHSAISISGTVFSPWAIEDNPRQQARDFGYRFSCDYRTDRLVDCLRYQDLASLMATANERDWENNRQPFWFKPVVDRYISGSALLRDFPLNLYKSGTFNRKPYLLIGTSSEGTLEYYLQAQRIKNFHELEQKISFLIRPYLKEYTSEEIMASAFAYKYFNRTHRGVSGGSFLPNNIANNVNSHFSLSNQYNNLAQGGYNAYGSGSGVYSAVSGYTDLELDRIFSEMLSDFLYLGPLDYAARFHSSQADTVFMIFNYLGATKSFGRLQRDVQQQVSRETYGVTHFHDLFFVLPNEYDPSNLQGTDIICAQNYARFIAEFVLFGVVNMRYLRYTSSSPSYQLVNSVGGQIQSISGSTGVGYRTGFLDFVNNYVYQLQDQATFFPPYFPSEQYKAYQSATWSLLAVVILLILLAAAIGIIFVIRNKKEQGDGQVTFTKRRHDEDSPLNE